MGSGFGGRSTCQRVLVLHTLHDKLGQPSVCYIDSRHSMLIGGHKWDVELVKLPLAHLEIVMCRNETSSNQFSLNTFKEAKYSENTLISCGFVSLTARIRW